MPEPLNLPPPDADPDDERWEVFTYDACSRCGRWKPADEHGDFYE